MSERTQNDRQPDGSVPGAGEEAPGEGATIITGDVTGADVTGSTQGNTAGGAIGEPPSEKVFDERGTDSGGTGE